MNEAKTVKTIQNEGGVLKLRDLNEYKNTKLIIFPDDTIKVVWDIIIMLLMLYTVTITPYRVAFIEQDSDPWITIDYVIDGLFMFDVIFNCFLAFTNSDEVLIVSHWKILKHYSSTWMTLDILSSLPFQLIIQNAGWGNLLRLSKLPRLYRLIKIFKLVRLLKLLKNRTKFMQFLECFSKISIGMERLVYFILCILVTCHLFACFLYFSSTFNNDNIYNWVFKYGIQDLTLEEKYLASVYWTVTILCTIGYGDITPASDIERGFVVFVELSGVFFYSYTIGTITSLMGQMDKEKAKLDNKLNVLQEISKRYSISRRFYKKLKSALEYNYLVLKSEQSKVISYLPKKMRMQLNIIMNKSLIEKNKFFENKQIKFITTVIDFLKPIKVKQGELIYKKGEFTEDMFLIKTGEIDLIDNIGSFELKLETYIDGDYFGDIELFLSETREYSTTATKSGELFTLSKEALFTNILFYFKNLKLEMIQKATFKRQMIKKTREELNSQDRSKEESNKIEELFHAPHRDYANLRKTLAPSSLAMLEENDDEAVAEELKKELIRITEMLTQMEIELQVRGSNGISG